MPSFRYIAAVLRRDIDDGVYPVGAQLPSVRELANQFGAAPMTIYNAIASLKQQQLVTTRHGVGTFVCEPPPPADNTSAAALALAKAILLLHARNERTSRCVHCVTQRWPCTTARLAIPFTGTAAP